MRTPVPPGGLNTVIFPADGVNFSGCSALMRHSIAWPRKHNRAGKTSLQACVGGNHNLALHQVYVGDHFRDRMLHLNARVHLNEIEFALPSIRNSMVPAFM